MHWSYWKLSINLPPPPSPTASTMQCCVAEATILITFLSVDFCSAWSSDFYNPYSYIFFSVMSVLVNCLNCDSPSPFWSEHVLSIMSFFYSMLSARYTAVLSVYLFLDPVSVTFWSIGYRKILSICFWSLITLKLTIFYMSNSSKTW